MIRTILLTFAGTTSIAAGLIFLPLPTPFGLPLILLGLGLVLTGSVAARMWTRHWRESHREMSDRLLPYETYLPASVRKALEETHPDDKPS
ncbi:MAG: hypothetical protein RLZ98_52 [Pseudomonadota bacterium]|jgi:hypothetical protein